MRNIQDKLSRWVLVGVCVAAIFLIYSRISPGEIQGKETPVDTRELWKLITVENPYQSYPSWPGKEGFYDSTMPPGNMLKLYVNDLALETILYKKGAFPDGSLLIKENYTEEKKLFLITVMYKVKGFNPPGHDWYWIKYRPDGEARLEGKADPCINCHIGVANNDYVFTGSIN